MMEFEIFRLGIVNCQSIFCERKHQGKYVSKKEIIRSIVGYDIMRCACIVFVYAWKRNEILNIDYLGLYFSENCVQ